MVGSEKRLFSAITLLTMRLGWRRRVVLLIDFCPSHVHSFFPFYSCFPNNHLFVISRRERVRCHGCHCSVQDERFRGCRVHPGAKNRCELVCFHYHYSCTPLGRGVLEITLCDEPHVNNTDEMGREVAVHIALVASSCSGMQQTLSGFDSPTYMC